MSVSVPRDRDVSAPVQSGVVLPEKPTQAVILAGGTGTRLRPLTDTIPKPMIRFHGRPFLEYLIDQVRDQGCTRVLLLLGYLSEVVQRYFGDGRSLGVQIEYSVSATEDDTGRRIQRAQAQIDPAFLLMYCDNLWPMDLAAMWAHFVETGAAAQVTVYANRDGYTRSNVEVDEDGMVVRYDKTPAAEGLQGVEIGYALMDKRVLSLLPDDNCNFEKVVYTRLAGERRLSAFVTEHRYYSVGSFPRLPLTDIFLDRRPAVVLDRDGVLNVKAPKAGYVTSWDAFRWLPGSKEAVRLLKSAGYTVIVVTNQAGIARGIMTEMDLLDIHRKMQASLADVGASVDAIYYCPHGWDEGCACRKPKPGMLFQAQRDFHLDLTRTYFVGDDDRDMQAGRAARAKTLFVDTEWPLLRLVEERILTHVSEGHLPLSRK